MKNVYAFCLIILFSFVVIKESAEASKPSFSASNYLRYGEGDENTFGRSEGKMYLEEKLTINMHWNNFLLGGRFEHDKPTEFGIDHNEVRKWYVEYRKGPWKARGGTFSSLFARGLAMNTYEEDAIGHDSEITGANLSYETNRTTINLLSGTLDYEKIPDFRDIVTYDLHGAALRRKLFSALDLGLNYVRSDVDQEIGFYKIEDSFRTNIAEIWAELITENFQLYGAVASNESREKRLFVKGRNNVYLSLNAYLPSSGLTLEYKNYRYGLTTPDMWDNTLRHNRLLAFQNPPTALKEHSWTLLSRRMHNINFDDEVGYQIDAYHAISDATTLNINGSVAGRQYRFTMDERGRFRRNKENTNWLPSLDPEFSPYCQAYTELEHYTANGSVFIGGLAYTYERIHNYYLPDLKEESRSFIVPFSFTCNLPRNYSVNGSAELQRFRETLHGDSYHTNNIFTLGMGKAPYLMASISAETLSDGYEADGKTLWVFGSVRYRYRMSNVLEIGYGDMRGGLVCTNGLCRYVPDYTGWRFSFETHFK